MLPLFTATVLLSATLVFVVEPMFAKMVLPLLGGTPAVWNTCVVFFQATLLLGYLYAHVATSRLSIRRQATVHAAVVLVPFAVLPIGLAANHVPPADANPVPWLIGLLAVAVGLPFFVVATTGPLLQRWFTFTGHRHARDPYFLYAASNLGSLIGLLSYPLALEPGLRLADQSRWWTAAYGLLVALLFACIATVWRRGGRVHGAPGPDVDPAAREGNVLEGLLVDERIGGRQRAEWLLLALVPSSLMLGVTTYLSVDIAAVPLLWVVPLTIYLLTFVLAFSSRPLVPQPLLGRLLPILALTLMMLILRDAAQPSWFVIPMHLAVFFVAAQACHGQLARARPSPRHLTEFYLWVSAGGVAGGLFNSIVAPLIFTRVVEYPLGLILACALAAKRKPGNQSPLHRDLLAAAAVGALAVVLVRAAQALDAGHGSPASALVLAIPLIACFSLAREPRRFALGLVLIFAASLAAPDRFGTVLHAERSFYGVHRVMNDPTGRFRVLLHGHTIHGRQSLDPGHRDEPLTYFHRTGPIGQVFSAALPQLDGGREIAVIGLGSGSLVSYGQAAQRWTFYEIDPAVERIAREPRYFTFLRDARATWRVVLGDARLSLREAPPGRYAVLVLDAFSSDAIPVHLLTREALDLYLAKLASDGLLVFHISNNYLQLRPVVAALAADAGLAGLAQFDGRIPADEARGGKTASEWVVLARSRTALGPLSRDRRWVALSPGGAPVWHDDFSNILGVFKWR